MQEFNKVTTTSNFIKELLNTTYLPVIRTVQAGDYIVEGRQYIYHCEIINCTSSGYILPYNNSTLSPKAKFSQIGEYTFGDKNDKLCTNFLSNHEGYDSLTHEKLGDYLRALRDMYGLNLMPLYNCFSKNHLAKYHIFSDRVASTNYNYHTKLYKVPIRFNTDYTICIENVGKTTFAPAFIRNEHLVKLNKTAIGNNIDVTNRYISLHTNDVISTYSGLRFFDPIVIRFNNIPETRTVNYLQKTGKEFVEPIQININHYFTPVEILSENEANAYGDNLFILDSSSDIGLAPASWSTNGAGIYYTSIVNPSELNWQVSDEANPAVEDLEPTTDTYIDLDTKYYIINTEFKEYSYTYDIEDIHCEMYDSIENILYLLIQLPESFDSNIVILEGDYRQLQSLKYFNNTDLKDFPENYLDKLFTHDLRLMRMNVPQVIPFSDTLIQFLLWHAICGLDSINLDMDRILSNLQSLYFTVDDKYYANYWYYRYRQLISNYAKLNSLEYIDDNLGYVTTEIEALLNRK